MAATELKGEEVAAQMRAQMRRDIEQLKAEHEVVPGLAVVLVGDNPASLSYVRGKRKACKNLGLHSIERRLPADIALTELLAEVETLNNDPSIHGILIQLPLPKGLDEDAVINALDPEKDVDGLHPVNLGRLLRAEAGFLPCTPHGVQQMLIHAGIEVEGKHVVVVGRSTLVGKSVANILLKKEVGANATVTITHSGTRDLGSFTRQADILIVAAGHPQMIGTEMVKDGAVVIDVGIEQVPDASRKRGYRLVGDVDFDQVKHRAGLITPVPGGVGPMTITMLLYNTIWSARRFNGLA